MLFSFSRVVSFLTLYAAKSVTLVRPKDLFLQFQPCFVTAYMTASTTILDSTNYSCFREATKDSLNHTTRYSNLVPAQTTVFFFLTARSNYVLSNKLK